MKIFSLLFGPLYYLCVIQVNWAAFYYYSETNKFYLRAHPSDGPAILWYGWMTTAALVSIPIALAVPKHLSDRLSNALLWLLPLGTVAAVFIHESRWFLQ